jgi:hypothetical protein
MSEKALTIEKAIERVTRWLDGRRAGGNVRPALAMLLARAAEPTLPELRETMTILSRERGAGGEWDMHSSSTGVLMMMVGTQPPVCVRNSAEALPAIRAATAAAIEAKQPKLTAQEALMELMRRVECNGVTATSIRAHDASDSDLRDIIAAKLAQQP